VTGFSDLSVGRVPQVATRLSVRDHLGTVRARLGIGRFHYTVAPGLYRVGEAGADAPVLVSANYKLSFDALRRELSGIGAWILVLDTRGINVWCAAGKGLFSSRELVGRVRGTGLETVVDHRRLILPQLAATGVTARTVKTGCGFEVLWGPVRATDIRAYLDAGLKAGPDMRRVTFDTLERLVLTPVEISQLPKPALWLLLAVFVLSGIGPAVFSLAEAWHRGGILATACAVGVLTGAVAAPVLLPWLPGTAFAVKGAIAGVVGGVASAALFAGRTGFPEALAMVLAAAAVSSYLTMNFTGSTPFTSPSGVEKEMRRAIPLQAGAAVVAAAVWVGAAFAA
jgi:hypothetical protein